jgi:hypothetical protein
LPIVLASAISLSKEKAEEQAKRNWIARIISRRKFSKIELKLFPYYAVDMTVEIEKRKKILGQKEKEKINLGILVSATSGQSAVYYDLPELEKVKYSSEQICDATIEKEKVLEKAKKEMEKFIMKRIKVRPRLLKTETTFFYRSYWATYYGEVKEGNKIYYLPIQADGYKIGRTT